MGGAICLDSEPGKGSSFSISLPCGCKEPNAIPDGSARTMPKPEAEPENPEEPGITWILMAEDNDANIELVKLYTRNTYALDVVNNAQDALARIKTKQYSCILMDINLGSGMDGAEAIEEIRKDPSYVHVPVIAMTGYTLKNEKEYIFSKGADYYLEKPFVKNVLMNLLSEVLSKKDTVGNLSEGG